MHVDAVVFGAAGYSGLELLKVLAAHPHVRIAGAASDTHAGTELRALTGSASHAGIAFEKTEAILSRSAAVSSAFLCVPPVAARAIAKSLRATSPRMRVIDLSHAHRLHGEAARAAYGHAPEEKGAYGLASLFSEDVIHAPLIANPGCYATAAITAIAPLVRAGVVEKDIVVSAASGTTGAGRSREEACSFSEMHGDMRAYKVLAHQHVPEIEAALARIAKEPPSICLTTHLLPVARGIFATVTAKLRGALDTDAITSLYRDAYARDPFVTLADKPEDVSLRAVVGTNQCMISAKSSGKAGGFVVVVAAIDNLLKGAAGQALENFNLAFGFDRATGLLHLTRHS